MSRSAGRSNPERRWLLLSHLLVAVTLGVPTTVVFVDGPAGSRVITVGLALAFAGWYTALYGARPQWHERTGVMVVYAVGALVLFTLLNARHGTYFLLLYSLLPQFFSVLPRGVAVIGVIGIVLLPPAVRGDLRDVVAGGEALFSILGTVGLGLVVTAIIEALGRQADEQRETIGDLEAARAEVTDLLAAARRDLHDRDALARMSSALIAARTRQAIASTLVQELSDHTAGIRGVALLATLDVSRHDAVVVESVAGTAAPPAGGRVRLPARWVEGQQDLEVRAVEALDPAERLQVDPAVRAVVLAPLDPTVATPAGPADPLVDVLWLGVSASDVTAGVRRDLLTVANQTALALANLRLAAQAAEQGRTAGMLQERQRLAHEIHDTLAQGFTSIVTQLEAADQALEHDPAAAVQHLRRARWTARDSLAEARRTVEALRPEPLERASLAEALRRVAARWAAAHGSTAQVNVVVDGEPSGNADEIDAALVRVAQEALTNVAKHASARTISVTLSHLDNLTLLDIQDDGIGFDAVDGAPRADSTGGYGLTSMRERMAAVGGELVVESRPGEGTTIAARVPTTGSVAGQGRNEHDEVIA